MTRATATQREVELTDALNVACDMIGYVGALSRAIRDAAQAAAGGSGPVPTGTLRHIATLAACATYLADLGGNDADVAREGGAE